MAACPHQAKHYDWHVVGHMLAANPSMVNVNPRGRWSALHHAAKARPGGADARKLSPQMGCPAAATTLDSTLLRPCRPIRRGFRAAPPQAKEEEVVRFLLSLGANVTLVSLGSTPVDLARGDIKKMLAQVAERSYSPAPPFTAPFPMHVGGHLEPPLGNVDE